MVSPVVAPATVATPVVVVVPAPTFVVVRFADLATLASSIVILAPTGFGLDDTG